MFNLKNWLIGFALGLAEKPLPIIPRELVAYLYNGLKLPELPEWDKTKYPYAVIFRSYSKYFFIATEIDVAKNGSPLKHPDFNSSNLIQFNYYGTQTGITENAENWGSLSRNSTNIYAGTVVWANYDVMNDDGTIFLEKTNPVPVYE